MAWSGDAACRWGDAGLYVAAGADRSGAASVAGAAALADDGDSVGWRGLLLYLAWRLAVDNGALHSAEGGAVASFAGGALMQWLNPKAWLAAIAGTGAFAADGDAGRVWQFAAIYCVVCYLSLACWAIAGTCLQPYLRAPQRIRVFNRVLAGLLVASAGYLVLA